MLVITSTLCTRILDFKLAFIGSSSRDMITFDSKTNKGFDFDVDLDVTNTGKQYTAKEIKQAVISAINDIAGPMGFAPCKDSTRVITLKKKDHQGSKIEYSCDFAIVRTSVGEAGSEREYVHFHKKHDDKRPNSVIKSIDRPELPGIGQKKTVRQENEENIHNNHAKPHRSIS